MLHAACTLFISCKWARNSYNQKNEANVKKKNSKQEQNREWPEASLIYA